MTAETTARRLADHPRFRWLRGAVGLKWRPQSEVLHMKFDLLIETAGEHMDREMRFMGNVPDLNDAATIGTIEAQVRAADPNSWFVLSLDDPGFWIERQRGTKSDALAVGSRTIGEAWALAFLEVAK